MGSKRKSRSRARSKSRFKPQPEPETTQDRIYANFVIPLAGLLSSIAAGLYDMGASPSKPQEENGNAHGNERTPLLPQAERGSDAEEEPRTKRVKRWFATNAVAVFMTLLIAAVMIILCVFFGGEP